MKIISVYPKINKSDKRISGMFFGVVLVLLISCNEKESAIEVLGKTINTIDTIETVYYKQDMERTNPRNLKDTIFRYREMYFKRLVSDSIVGVKGHWYMYVDDKENVIYEDIYDGNRLIRKNNQKKIARIYDLVQYPDFKQKHFWSHNTLYGMQYEFRYILENADSYMIERLFDTIIDGKECYQVLVSLENKSTMPGFLTQIEDNEGFVSNTTYFIEKETYYPIRIKGESYSMDNPEQKVFMDQSYYDIKFNIIIDEADQFDISGSSIAGFEKVLMTPD